MVHLRKLLSVLLVLALTFTLPLAAFAAPVKATKENADLIDKAISMLESNPSYASILAANPYRLTVVNVSVDPSTTKVAEVGFLLTNKAAWATSIGDPWHEIWYTTSQIESSTNSPYHRQEAMMSGTAGVKWNAASRRFVHYMSPEAGDIAFVFSMIAEDRSTYDAEEFRAAAGISGFFLAGSSPSFTSSYAKSTNLMTITRT